MNMKRMDNERLLNAVKRVSAGCFYGERTLGRAGEEMGVMRGDGRKGPHVDLQYF